MIQNLHEPLKDQHDEPTGGSNSSNRLSVPTRFTCSSFHVAVRLAQQQREMHSQESINQQQENSPSV